MDDRAFETEQLGVGRELGFDDARRQKEKTCGKYDSAQNQPQPAANQHLGDHPEINHWGTRMPVGLRTTAAWPSGKTVCICLGGLMR